MRRITRRLKAAKPLVCVPFLVGVCLTAPGQVHAQTVYRYEVRDPLTGAGVTDLNTVFWRWTGPSKQQNQALAQQNLGLLAALDAANARNTQLQSALVAAQQSAAQQTVFVTDQIQELVNDLRAAFRNAAFVLPGASPFEQLRNLVNAIIELNRGRKEGLYANLGGRP